VIDSWQLNDVQRRTLGTAFGRRLTLIQGPPGTGKTYTAVHLIRLLTSAKTGLKILCAADSNGAVGKRNDWNVRGGAIITLFIFPARSCLSSPDNLLENLIKYKVNALRVSGMPGKVREEARDATLQAAMAKNKAMEKLNEQRAKYEELKFDKSKFIEAKSLKAEIMVCTSSS
jgi:regulator of nonsense transcripts 1